MTAIALIEVSNAIERCADIATDAAVTARPELNRESLKRAYSQELWQAVKDITELSASGAVLA